ncbi:hypothetical protein LDK02_05835 [Fusobacterium animalis]|uniref:hypothetical protein n=1 Tax=Fusobacterium animalis TaxID=76859 RepID=UPI0030CEF675
MTVTILKLFFATFFAFIFYYFLDIFSEIFAKKKNLKESFDIFKTFFSSYNNFKKLLSFNDVFLEEVNNKNKQHNDNIGVYISFKNSSCSNLNINKELTMLSNSFLKKTKIAQPLETINNVELFEMLDDVINDTIIEFSKERKNTFINIINVFYNYNIMSNIFTKRKNNKMDSIESEVSNEYKNQKASFSRY